MKKTITIALVVIAIAAVAAFVGFKIYESNKAAKEKERIEQLVSQGDNAVAANDYATAYKMYADAGSEKINEVLPHVQGNTPENLMFMSGILAEDEENLYYLVLGSDSYSFTLVKENKATKEKVNLSKEAGGSLNVTSDWIYFVDIQEGFVKRILKDGSITESVLETPIYQMAVFEDTMYYIAKEFENPNNLPLEQCELLESQGMMTSYQRLFKMDIATKATEKVSDVSLSTFAIYGNKIYYLSLDEANVMNNAHLYRMDFNGQNAEAVVNRPVASFLVRDNQLYYMPMLAENATSESLNDPAALDYTLRCKNLTDGTESIIDSNYMVTYINTNENKLFFMAYNREEFLAASAAEDPSTATPPTPVLYAYDYATAEIKQLVAGEVSIFNVIDDDLILFLENQGMCRVKADATGFEPVTAAPETEVPATETSAEGATAETAPAETTEETPVESAPAE